jgi:hypothetical protein
VLPPTRVCAPAPGVIVAGPSGGGNARPSKGVRIVVGWEWVAMSTGKPW